MVVALAEELRAEDGGAGKAAEDRQVEYEQKLVDDRDTGHRFRAQPADHHVVEQADKARDALLDDHRNDEDQKVVVKRAVADKGFLEFLEHDFPPQMIVL